MTKKEIKAVEAATKNIESVSTKDLVAYFNAQQNDLPVESKQKEVKKFADRKTAIRRVTKVVELVVAEYGSAPVIGASDEAAPAPVKKEKKEKKPVDGETTVEARRSNSEGIAKSWLVPEIAAKRSQRSAVEVDGTYYSSVRMAYLALDLDLKGHIAFRMLLKESGSLKDEEGREWVEVPLNYDKD